MNEESEMDTHATGSTSRRRARLRSNEGAHLPLPLMRWGVPGGARVGGTPYTECVSVTANKPTHFTENLTVCLCAGNALLLSPVTRESAREKAALEGR